MTVYATGDDVVPPRHWAEHGLVRIVSAAPATGHLVFEDVRRLRCPCACDARDGYAATEDAVVVARDRPSWIGHAAYRIATRCPRTCVVVLAWLTAYRFDAFRLRFGDDGGGLRRSRVPAAQTLFRPTSPPLPCGCKFHRLVGDPVFCLSHVVLAGLERRGPTVESVTSSPLDATAHATADERDGGRDGGRDRR